MTEDLAQLSAEYEALIQFLYLAPVGLVQLDADGEIAMINPIAAQLLMPHSRNGGLDNLFVALEDVAPDLRERCIAAGADDVIFKPVAMDALFEAMGRILARDARGDGPGSSSLIL